MTRWSVKVHIPPDAAGRGSANEYVFDDTTSDYGTTVARVIADALDEPHSFGDRLVQLRRHLAQLTRQRIRTHQKPDGGRVRGSRVSYRAEAIRTGQWVRIEIQLLVAEKDRANGLPPNLDEDEPAPA